MKTIFCAMMIAMTFVTATVAENLWGTNFEAAKEAAVERGVPILVDFTGSDWCGWCIRLKEEVFEKDAFLEYAKENLVLLELDFPMQTELPAELSEQNEKLRERYQIRGFPTILLLDAEGEELARTGYQAGGPEKYIEHLQALLADSDEG